LLASAAPCCALPAQQPAEDGNRNGTLYPAYQVEEGVRRWGYIDGSGSFVIAPQFDAAEEFGADGLAVVIRDGGSALIDRSGQLVQPVASYILTTGDGVRIRYLDDGMQLLNERGEVVFAADWISGSFSSGMTPFSQGGLYGYVCADGTVAVQRQFAWANPFEGGTAVVRLRDERYAVIDTTGAPRAVLRERLVRPAGEGIYAYRECDDCAWGYRSPDGEVDLAPRFLDAGSFRDGLAVVGVGEDYGRIRFGVIDRQGNPVIPAEYGMILYLGDGLFEVAQPMGDDWVPPAFKPHALFNAKGEQLTDFQYYDMALTPYGVSVSDETSTYFLDRSGHRADDLPAVDGIGSLRAVGDLIAADVDGDLIYLTPAGGIVWQPSGTWTLPGGTAVVDHKYRKGRAVLVHYPELTGLPDKAVQNAINARLRALFLEEATAQGGWDDDLTATTDVRFAVRQTGRVLAVERDIYVYPLGAAHGMPYRNYYHFDLNTGAEYRLADLFRPGSTYPERLQELVRRQIAADPGYVFDPNPEVRPDHPYTVDAEGLQVYWAPYEIAPYAAGFPTFTIPWADLEGWIDTGGAFWQALRAD